MIDQQEIPTLLGRKRNHILKSKPSFTPNMNNLDSLTELLKQIQKGYISRNISLNVQDTLKLISFLDRIIYKAKSLKEKLDIICVDKEGDKSEDYEQNKEEAFDEEEDFSEEEKELSLEEKEQKEEKRGRIINFKKKKFCQEESPKNKNNIPSEKRHAQDEKDKESKLE